MMLLIDLFDRDNISCPEWLSNVYLEDEWLESVYSFEEGNHTWNLETPIKNVRITFNGDEYNFYGVKDGELIRIETITETHEIQY